MVIILKFLEEFFDFETMVIRKIFLQLKFDILSENNSRLVASAKKKIKKDLEKQLETFDKFYDRFRRYKSCSSKQELLHYMSLLIVYEKIFVDVWLMTVSRKKNFAWVRFCGNCFFKQKKKRQSNYFST